MSALEDELLNTSAAAITNALEHLGL